MNSLVLSSLSHTWVLDLDGTIVKHNGYLIDGKDSFLPNAKEFLKNIPDKDMIIFITSRKKEYSDITESFLSENNIHYDRIIYDAPYGERILINDDKPSGLKMAYSISPSRDEGIHLDIQVDSDL